MIELVTITGLRRSVVVERIAEICELPAGKRSATVITLFNGETVFVSNSYDEVINMYYGKKQEPTSLADEVSQ